MPSPRDVVLSWVDAFNRRDADATAAHYHDEAVNLQVAEGAPTVGREAMSIRSWLSVAKNAFSR
jgi:ketosteroid isomerase-like protein